MCFALGIVNAATVCDHVEPHRGDPVSFWGGPFQSLCAQHHSRDKQRAERGRPVVKVGADGWPMEPTALATQNAVGG
jgi:5-methylcytosine-specific restriction protein A